MYSTVDKMSIKHFEIVDENFFSNFENFERKIENLEKSSLYGLYTLLYCMNY